MPPPTPDKTSNLHSSPVIPPSITGYWSRSTSHSQACHVFMVIKQLWQLLFWIEPICLLACGVSLSCSIELCFSPSVMRERDCYLLLPLLVYTLPHSAVEYNWMILRGINEIRDFCLFLCRSGLAVLLYLPRGNSTYSGTATRARYGGCRVQRAVKTRRWSERNRDDAVRPFSELLMDVSHPSRLCGGKKMYTFLLCLCLFVWWP